MKFDFDDNSKSLEYVLPDGEFGTEPIYVSKKEATEEDDGFVLVQNIDGIRRKSVIVILDTKTMKPLFRARAPELGLHGLHAAFFPFDVGCNATEGCRPVFEESSSGQSVTDVSYLLFLLIFVNIFWFW